jgi:hypothetical protein
MSARSKTGELHAVLPLRGMPGWPRYSKDLVLRPHLVAPQDPRTFRALYVVAMTVRVPGHKRLQTWVSPELSLNLPAELAASDEHAFDLACFEAIGAGAHRYDLTGDPPPPGAPSVLLARHLQEGAGYTYSLADLVLVGLLGGLTPHSGPLTRHTGFSQPYVFRDEQANAAHADVLALGYVAAAGVPTLVAGRDPRWAALAVQFDAAYAAALSHLPAAP